MTKQDERVRDVLNRTVFLFHIIPLCHMTDLGEHLSVTFCLIRAAANKRFTYGCTLSAQMCLISVLSLPTGPDGSLFTCTRSALQKSVAEVLCLCTSPVCVTCFSVTQSAPRLHRYTTEPSVFIMQESALHVHFC